jgi:hypothetical protein
MVLLSVYDHSGCVGRCDARCYDAISSECDCICGGKNHGAGVKQAAANVEASGVQMLDEFRQSKMLGFTRAQLPLLLGVT